MSILEKISKLMNHTFIFIAGTFMVAMILITCANIFSRLVWVPVKGAFELMGFFGAVVTAFALGYTQANKAHISVDILVNRFPKRVQAIINGINCVIGMLFFILAGWQIAKLANTLRTSGEVTETLRIIYYPFTYGVAIGCFLLSLVLAVELAKLVFSDNGAT
ncbi:MAG: TRAP transporter small permease [Desulfobacterales bacterium]|jgi:TRAP-type C4-dicarboxylate transport system permease small subunit